MLEEGLTICHILQFVPVNDWPIIKPCLVSRMWHQVFRSESFAESYLHNLFRLTKEDQQLLKKTMQYFANNHGLIVPFVSHWRILDAYVTQSTSSSVKLHQLGQLLKFAGTLTQSEANLLKQIADQESCRTQLKEQLKNLFSNGLVDDYDGNTVSPSIVSQALCGEIKELFVTGIQRTEQMGSSETSRRGSVDFVVFLGFGFPMVFSYEFSFSFSWASNRVDERCLVYGDEFYANDYQGSNGFNKDLLAQVKEGIFHTEERFKAELPHELERDWFFNTCLFRLFDACSVDEAFSNFKTDEIDVYGTDDYYRSLVVSLEPTSSRKTKRAEDDSEQETKKVKQDESEEDE